MKERLSETQRLVLAQVRDVFTKPPLWLRGNTLQSLKRLGLLERKVFGDDVCWKRTDLGNEEIRRATFDVETGEARDG